MKKYLLGGKIQVLNQVPKGDVMKTIKMVADELGVTKQTIVNNAKSLNISFEKENGINYINEMII